MQSSIKLMQTGWNRAPAVFGGPSVDYSRLHRRVHPPEEAARISCLLMDRLASLRQRYGVRVFVIMQYGATELLADRTEQPPILDCARERGFEVLDSFEPFRRLAREDLGSFRRLLAIAQRGQGLRPAQRRRQSLHGQVDQRSRVRPSSDAT
jgi:hypothetical protein